MAMQLAQELNPACGTARKLFCAAGLLALFGLLLVTIYYLHVNYFRVDVVLYSALLDVLIALGLTCGVAVLAKLHRRFNGFERLQLLLIGLLCGYVLVISLPTVIDRSLSFYLLEEIDRHGGGIRLEQFDDVIAIDYLRDHRVAEVRLTEQTVSGTLTVNTGCVRLTAQGKRLVRFSRLFRAHWLPKKRRLVDTYSDSLIAVADKRLLNHAYACAP